MSRDLSHDTRELLVLARGDAPPPLARDNIWDGLERAILPATAVGLGTAAAIAKPVAAVATSPTAWHPVAIAATKPVALAPAAAAAPSAVWLSAATAMKVGIGALVGTAFAISAAIGVSHASSSPKLLESADTHGAVVYGGDEGVLAFNPPSFPAAFAGTAAPSPSPAPLTEKEEAHAAFRAVARASLTSHTSSDDTLLREASLVGEARSALLRGDPQTALVSVQAARREGRNLEPEELSIEARALRALGRESEATQLDGTLRTRYPDNALVR